MLCTIAICFNFEYSVLRCTFTMNSHRESGFINSVASVKMINCYCSQTKLD